MSVRRNDKAVTEFHGSVLTQQKPVAFSLELGSESFLVDWSTATIPAALEE